MTKIKIVIGLLIVLIVSLIALLLTTLYSHDYKLEDSIVFIESISDDSVKDGMGFVYKIENSISYIVTNYHVIYNTEELYVYNLSNKKALATVVAYDSYYDIAILKIEDELSLKKAKLSNNNVKENDSVYYYNISDKVIKSSIVLSTDEEINISTNYGNSFYNVTSIKGDIEAGNSGGPVFDKKNYILGLLSLKKDNSDIAFFIPIDYAMNVVSNLENHELLKPNLGAVFASSTNINVLNKHEIPVPQVSGVVVIEIVEGYPLELAGLLKGDVITKINETPIKNVNDLQNKIYSCNVNEQITIEYYRNNILNIVNVKLDK